MAATRDIPGEPRTSSPQGYYRPVHKRRQNDNSHESHTRTGWLIRFRQGKIQIRAFRTMQGAPALISKLIQPRGTDVIRKDQGIYSGSIRYPVQQAQLCEGGGVLVARLYSAQRPYSAGPGRFV